MGGGEVGWWPDGSGQICPPLFLQGREALGLQDVSGLCTPMCLVTVCFPVCGDVLGRDFLASVSVHGTTAQLEQQCRGRGNLRAEAEVG